MGGIMLIRNAEIPGRGIADVRIAGGRIAAIGQLDVREGEAQIDGRGGALLPGLHDHHIHLAAAAVRAASIMCGPPEISTPAELSDRLSAAPGAGWLRGIGYHESVMGLPDAAMLDTLVPDRPLRIQHRSGRMWLFNTAAIQCLLAAAAPPPGMERDGGGYTGRLFDEDAWLQTALGSTPPDFAAVSAELARCGVTGLTDMSPRNDAVMAAHFAEQAQSGALRQRVMLAGTRSLAEAPRSPLWALGPAKLHLHENALPPFEDAAAFITSAHRQGRPVAVHCTTETELVFTLAALEAAGTLAGDRIEHAGIAPDHLVAEIARLSLAVVSQPHFIAERGDRYLLDVAPALHPALYRLQAFVAAGVTLAGGSDAPFGSLDPWAAMRAATTRATQAGAIIGPDEALSAQQALALYLTDPADLSRQRTIEPGAPADLCLLARPWAQAREALTSAGVRATIAAGRIIFDNGVDKAPA